jgi:hypothetical protein
MSDQEKVKKAKVAAKPKAAPKEKKVIAAKAAAKAPATKKPVEAKKAVSAPKPKAEPKAEPIKAAPVDPKPVVDKKEETIAPPSRSLMVINTTEELAMMASDKLQKDAYGVAIKEELNKIGFPIATGALYACLSRLQSRGFIKSARGQAKSMQGGKGVTYYSVTGEGRKVMKQTAKRRESLQQDVAAQL